MFVMMKAHDPTTFITINSLFAKASVIDFNGNNHIELKFDLIDTLPNFIRYPSSLPRLTHSAL